MVNILRQAGLSLQSIFEVYPGSDHERVSDPEWIRLCGENNWIVITGDKRIEKVPENRQAVIDARVKVFLLNDSNTKPEFWAAAVLLGQYKMQDIIDAANGPFFVTIGKRCDTHVQRPRRPSSYVDPLSTPHIETQPEAQAPPPEPVTVPEEPAVEEVSVPAVRPGTTPRLPF